MDGQGGGRAAAPSAASSASQPAATKTQPAPSSAARDPRLSELSRLFIVCGRGRKVDELRALFSTCGAIKHLHLALDRSKKSRYEDPADAAVAIEKLDHLKLDDGHILKVDKFSVTVAKERPVGGNGKLKRDQHARQDQDEKTEGELGDEEDGSIDARLPGKRQRSSPPVAALPLGPSRVSSAFLLETHRLERVGVNPVEIKTEGNGLATLEDELMEPDGNEKQVQHVLNDMVMVIEQHKTQSKPSNNLYAAYQQVISASDQKGKQKRGKKLTVVVHGASEEENSTDSLASSIRSVSLASTPMTTRGSRFELLRTPRGSRDGETILPRPKLHLRRRRQSLDSGSSTDDGTGGSGTRRKRSNTTTSPPPTLKAQLRQPLSPLKKNSDRSDISLSPEALKAEIISKKVGKRQSSDNRIEESYRLAKQQATQERRDHGGNMVDRGLVRPTTVNVDSSYGKDRAIKIELQTEPTEPERTKLFFTSTYKFTEQELEAMFAVYGDFESVDLVKSFGRVKTMAYVRYSKSSTAAFVVKSFREESSEGHESPEKSEFMTLSFAHETNGLQLQQHARIAHFPEKSLGSSNFDQRLPPANVSASSTATIMHSGGKDRLWVLLLYDRFLATHMLSSVVSSLSGMEFMDIKVVKSTGEAQGVAFVKFDSETNATQAALQLHQMELPLGSGKFLQAIVILAPSLFTTTHGSNSISNNESMRLDRSAGERVVTGSSDDVDLRAVEARFAHLMRSTEQQHSSCSPYSLMPSPREAAPSDLGHQLSMSAGLYPPPHSSGFRTPMGLSGGMEYYPMQLVAYPPPPPQQPFQPYASFAGPANYQQHQHFASVSGWMETSPYYRSEAPQQYPFSCAPEQEMAFPVVNQSNGVAINPDLNTVQSKPRSSCSSSEQMDIEVGSSICSSQMPSSIQVSTSEPLELVTLVSALQDCPGVLAFAKSSAGGVELTGYTVDFSNEAQALEAVRKLDGVVCGGQKLQVMKSTSMKQRGIGGGKGRSGSGRRKRQRVDPRSRK